MLLVTIDTLRADRLGCYGFGLAHTPAIDRLAARRACAAPTPRAPRPITLPAHSSIMTGLYPPAHGVRDNGNYALGPDAVTLAERLRAAGYRTGAFVSAAVLARRYGLDQGFDIYDDDLWAEDEPELFMIRDRPAARTADARARLARRLAGATTPDQPFFLWVHFFDPHQPYDVALARPGRAGADAYDAEIAEADRGVGRVIDWLRASTARSTTRSSCSPPTTARASASTASRRTASSSTTRPIHVPLVWRLPARAAAGDDVRRRRCGTSTSCRRCSRCLGAAAAATARRESISLPALAGARRRRPTCRSTPRRGSPRRASAWRRSPVCATTGGSGSVRRGPSSTTCAPTRASSTNLYPGRAGGARRRSSRRSTASSRDSAAPRARRADARRSTARPRRCCARSATWPPPEQRAEMAGMDPKDGMALYAQVQEARQLAQNEQWERRGRLLERGARGGARRT